MRVIIGRVEIKVPGPDADLVISDHYSVGLVDLGVEASRRIHLIIQFPGERLVLSSSPEPEHYVTIRVGDDGAVVLVEDSAGEILVTATITRDGVTVI